MASNSCGRPSCTVAAGQLCAKCKKIRYCSRECQAKHWPSHKTYCKWLAAENEDTPAPIRNAGGTLTDALTVYFALNAVKKQQPAAWEPLAQEVLTNSTTVSIVYIGARNESCMDLAALRDVMKVLFPSLSELKVALIGNELSDAPEREACPGCTFQIINGFFHDVYSRLPNYFQEPQIAALLCPGLSTDSAVRTWTPTMEILLENKTLCVCSGYSASGKWTSDGVLDDYILQARYGVHFLLPKTVNTAPHIQPGYYLLRNAYYLVFRGMEPEFNPTPEKGVTKELRVRFLSWVGPHMVHDEGYPPEVGESFAALVRDIQSGAVDIPDSVTLSQLERIAMSYQPTKGDLRR
jgi:MYND finger